MRKRTNDDSNQPALLCSLLRVLVVLGFSKCAQRRFRSDCANAQADLNLCFAHASDVTFSDDEVLKIPAYFLKIPAYLNLPCYCPVRKSGRRVVFYDAFVLRAVAVASEIETVKTERFALFSAATDGTKSTGICGKRCVNDTFLCEISNEYDIVKSFSTRVTPAERL